ncbi:MAG: hypothetical protein ACI8X5_003221 [Planctomycetota bacterium]|jgi:hypothetical protein
MRVDDSVPIEHAPGTAELNKVSGEQPLKGFCRGSSGALEQLVLQGLELKAQAQVV